MRIVGAIVVIAAAGGVVRLLLSSVEGSDRIDAPFLRAARVTVSHWRRRLDRWLTILCIVTVLTVVLRAVLAR